MSPTDTTITCFVLIPPFRNKFFFFFFGRLLYICFVVDPGVPATAAAEVGHREKREPPEEEARKPWS